MLLCDLEEMVLYIGVMNRTLNFVIPKNDSDNLIPQIFPLQEWKQIFHGLHQPSWDAFLPSLSYVTLSLLQSSHGNLLRVFPSLGE